MGAGQSDNERGEGVNPSPFFLPGFGSQSSGSSSCLSVEAMAQSVLDSAGGPGGGPSPR